MLSELAAQAGPRVDDGCKASRTDGCGNARSIFLGARVIALLGCEWVEGQLQGQGTHARPHARTHDRERIVEQRRINLSPGAKEHLPMRPTPFD